MEAPAAPAPSSPVSHVYATGGTLVSLTWHEPRAALPEAVVQDVWARQWLRGPLRTTDGQPLTVLVPGTLSRDGGPDFRHARFRIGEDVLCGDVEVHTTSGLWLAHGHAADPRYNAVALHVTLHADAHTGTLRRADGTLLPEIVLAPHLDGPLAARVHRFFAAPAAALPCAWGFPGLGDDALHAHLRALARERLRRRAVRLGQDGDLDEALYRRVARALGYRPNADAFEALALRVPLAVLHTLPDAHDRTALLLGVAGLLPAPGALEASAYAGDLARRFTRFAGLAPALEPGRLQRGGLRPAATPELRLAQLAALTGDDALLGPGAARRLARTLAAPDPLPLLFEAGGATPEAFWHTHYHFGRAAAWHPATVGHSTLASLFANAVLPAALAAGADPEAVLGVLARLPAEADPVVARYALPKAIRRSALTTQALHEWAERLCAPLRCLACPTGQALLSTPAPTSVEAA